MSYKAKNRIHLLAYLAVFFVLLVYTLLFLTTVGWKLLGLFAMTGFILLVNAKLSDISNLIIQLDKVIVTSRNEEFDTQIMIEKKHSGMVFFPVLKIVIEELEINQTIYCYTGKKIILTSRCKGQKRGRYEEVFIHLETTDLFYMFTKEAAISIQVDWTIFPVLIPNSTRILSLLNQVRRDDTLGDHSYDIKSHRAYVHGDSMKQVDWKLSSKWQEIMVKEYHYEKEEQPLFIYLAQPSFYMEPLLDVFFSLYSQTKSSGIDFYLLGEGVSFGLIKDTNDFARISKSSDINLTEFLKETSENIVLFIPEITNEIRRIVETVNQKKSVQVITYQDIKDSGWMP